MTPFALNYSKPEIANSIPQIHSVNKQNTSDDKEHVSYQDVFGHLDYKMLTLSEALEFMEMSKSKFLKLLATDETWSKLRKGNDQKFPARFLINLKQKVTSN